MNEQERTAQELPAEVLNAIRAGHRIEAIKRLRETRGMDLRQAKLAVDEYLRAHPGLAPARRKAESRTWLTVALLAGAAYCLYRWLG